MTVVDPVQIYVTLSLTTGATSDGSSSLATRSIAR